MVFIYPTVLRQDTVDILIAKIITIIVTVGGKVDLCVGHATARKSCYF